MNHSTKIVLNFSAIIDAYQCIKNHFIFLNTNKTNKLQILPKICSVSIFEVQVDQRFYRHCYDNM